MEFQLLPNNQILYKEIVVTPNQEAIEWKPVGMFEKIDIQTDKTTVPTNEVTNIALQWQIFDLQKGEYLNDDTNINNFIVIIAGEKAEITPTNGTAEITFSSTEPGEYKINSTNTNTSNANIKVVVTDV